MPTYTVETRGDARELYSIEADSPEQARAIYERGEATAPYLTEVMGADVYSVEEES